MDIQTWLAAAIADAKRRGLPDLEPLLTALATSTEALRNADFGQPDAAGGAADEFAAHAAPSRDPRH